MISIRSIQIREFRGIRKLDLDFSYKNFGICGSNGTGKSGVVDAIEFCLTGNITRLSGEGAGDLSVSKHGPHVDAGEKSAKSTVTICALLPGLGKEVTITRSVKSPNKVKIEPNDADVVAAVEAIQLHPEFALSRREIAKYVITPAGKRAVDVQTLLRLDDLEKTRKALNKVANDAKRRATAAEDELKRARKHFLDALGPEPVKPDQVLGAINAQRRVLGLEEFGELTPETSLTEGLDDSGETLGESRVVKTVALGELKSLLEASESDEEAAKRLAVWEMLAKLKLDIALLRTIQQQALVRAGLPLIDGDACPLCDKPWQEDELRTHLEIKLESAATAQTQIDELNELLDPLRANLLARRDALRKASQHAQAIKVAGGNETLASMETAIEESVETLMSATEESQTLDRAIELLSARLFQLPDETVARLKAIYSAVEALPDQSKEADARRILVLAEDRYRSSIARKQETREAKRHAEIAETICMHYNEAQTNALNEIYDAVADDFSRFYRILNRGDEDQFTGTLVSEPAKLSLNVDFYGRGQFPPGAYHSEGHQDGMGLCLYLALMKHTLGDQFRFSVLDDVLMSVDTGHRREVCRLLKSEFSNTQFVLTTHDRIWLQYMRTEALIENAQIFAGWNVDTGPQVLDSEDVWTQINVDLAAENVPGAAAYLRRYLEHIGHVLSDGLRAPVPYSGDGCYTLNDIFPPGLAQVRKDLKLARNAAVSWGNTEAEESIVKMLEGYDEAMKASKSEEWAINPSVHYNEWQNLQADEFSDVVAAFKSLIDLIHCGVCQSMVHTTFHKGKREQLRCVCGAISFDLRKKSESN